MPRLYLPGRIAPGPITLDVDQTRRLTAVMRLREGDEFRVFSGDGREWRAIVGKPARSGLRAEVRDVTRQEPLPGRVVEVWLPLIRPNRFDWAVEKCVEAGADIIRPLVGAHSARGDGASPARQQRWERIAVEALEQCGRLHQVAIEPPAPFAQLLARHRGALIVADAAGAPWTATLPLLPERGQVSVAIGPEGGFDAGEIAAARAAGALVASLGPNVLRSETAAVVATALLRAR